MARKTFTLEQIIIKIATKAKRLPKPAGVSVSQSRLITAGEKSMEE